MLLDPKVSNDSSSFRSQQAKTGWLWPHIIASYCQRVWKYTRTLFDIVLLIPRRECCNTGRRVSRNWQWFSFSHHSKYEVALCPGSEGFHIDGSSLRTQWILFTSTPIPENLRQTPQCESHRLLEEPLSLVNRSNQCSNIPESGSNEMGYNFLVHTCRLQRSQYNWQMH